MLAEYFMEYFFLFYIITLYVECKTRKMENMFSILKNNNSLSKSTQGVLMEWATNHKISATLTLHVVVR